MLPPLLDLFYQTLFSAADIHILMGTKQNALKLWQRNIDQIKVVTLVSQQQGLYTFIHSSHSTVAYIHLFRPLL